MSRPRYGLASVSHLLLAWAPANPVVRSDSLEGGPPANVRLRTMPQAYPPLSRVVRV
jgi:hypothetical protein